MAIKKKIAPPNSVVLVGDPYDAKIPDTMSGSLIAATSSCIAVGCQSDVDGETEFILGATHEVDPGSQPAFKGSLKVSSGKITIQTVLGETILEVPVRQSEIMIRIWANDVMEPDEVRVGISE